MLPAGPGRPEVVNTLEYGFDPMGFFSRARARYGDAYTVRLMDVQWVVLSDPDAIREVFRHGGDDLNSGEANLPLRPLIGTRNVLLLDGDEHLARRRLVLPPFHGDRMRAYDSIVRDEAAREMDRWPVGRGFAVGGRMQSITFEVILRAVFGVSEGAQLDRLRAALRGLQAWTTHPRQSTIFALAGPERLMRMRGFVRQRAAVDAEVLAQIRSRRSDPELASRSDVLSLLLQARSEDGAALSDADVRDELVTLLVAGHETTSALLTWAVHELARAPDVAARVAAGEEGLVDAVVDETLRLWPAVPLVVRVLRRPLSFGGLSLDAGTTVAPCALLVHRRPELWPTPDAWKPDRFLGGGRPRAGTYFPFGGGVRRCVGAAFASFEARIVLSELCRRFALRPAVPRREPLFRRGVILVPLLGGRVRLSTR